MVRLVTPLLYLRFISDYEEILEYAQDHAELGAALNGFSLNETGSLSGAIEKTGQAVDATYMSTTKLVSIISLCCHYPFFENLYVLGSRTRTELGRTNQRICPILVHY